MSEYVYAGLTSQSVDVLLLDSSSSTGAGLSGLVYNSAGLVASYRKGATGSRVAITLATQTVGGSYSSGGFVEIEATHMKGVYRFDIPDAAVDTEGFATLYFYGATNLKPTALRIDCRPLPVDLKKVATQTASASGAVTFPGTIASSTNITAGTITSVSGAVGSVTEAVVLDSASITAVQSGLATASSVAAIDAKIGTPETSLSAMVGNVPTIAEFEARTLAAASYRQNISLRGTDMTEAKAFDLLLAASAGVTSQPSGTTEKFKFLDGNDAFTTTFDTNGNRTGVSLA